MMVPTPVDGGRKCRDMNDEKPTESPEVNAPDDPEPDDAFRRLRGLLKGRRVIEDVDEYLRESRGRGNGGEEP